jgi:hypothetical protein
MRGSSCSFHPPPTIGRQPHAVSSRRIATVAVALAMASGVGWALIELGRPTDRPRVPAIVIGESPDGEDDPGTTPPENEGPNPDPSVPGGSGGSPSSGAEPPPAPPPPPAGDEDGDDDGGENADD